MILGSSLAARVSARSSRTCLSESVFGFIRFCPYLDPSCGFVHCAWSCGGAPDLPDGVGDALAGDVRGGAVDGFEEAGELAFGVDVAAGGDADGTGTRRAQIREDVAEEVAGDDDVEPVGVHNEVRRQDID